jgi:predicted 2-oxoglutarate/Fe(II)-dependent dioxygenase YbiX
VLAALGRNPLFVAGHHMTPVTAGERPARGLGQGHEAVVALTGTYHNLLRMWVEV